MIDYQNILSEEDVETLFTDTQELEFKDDDDNLFALPSDNKEDNNTEDTETIKVDEPESVGDELENQSGEDAQSAKQNPSPRFYSSITKALVDEGVFSDFDISEEDINNVKTAKDFIDLGRKWSEAIRSEDDKRILQATQAGVEQSKIRQYEQTIRTLNQQFSEDVLKKEDPQSEALRKQIIYQDYINRNFSQERAQKAMERSFAAGTDVEDAIDSLVSVKEYFTQAYESEIAEAKAQQAELEKQIKRESDQLKKDLLESTEPIKGISVDKPVRQKAYDVLVKPVAKDESGNSLTEIQKFEKENPVQFRKALGVLYVLTDGFKDVGKIIKQQAKAEVKKGMSELERTLMNSGVKADGSLQLAGIDGYDEGGSLSGWTLA